MNQPNQETGVRWGIMQISQEALMGIDPSITFDACSLQRELRDQGVFARLHRYLLLPDSYTIKALFYARHSDWRQWEIWLESPDFPLTGAAWAGELPEVSPVYCMVEGEAHMVEVRVTPRPLSLSITGGIDWFWRAMTQNLNLTPKKDSG